MHETHDVYVYSTLEISAGYISKVLGEGAFGLEALMRCVMIIHIYVPCGSPFLDKCTPRRILLSQSHASGKNHH